MIQNLNKKLILFIIIVVVLSVGGITYYKKRPSSRNTISPQETGEKVVNYINENIPGVTASLVDIVEEKGLFKITLKIGKEELTSYVTKDGTLLFPQAIDLEVKPPSPPSKEEKNYTIGNFLVSEDEPCEKEGKPIVYFFTSSTCPHCQWEHPIVEGIVAKFRENIVFHDNVDSEVDMDIFKKYSTGGVPTLVLGCKYYRVGSGEALGKEEESRVLTALICMLTKEQPSGVCDTVKDLIEQIKT